MFKIEQLKFFVSVRGTDDDSNFEPVDVEKEAPDAASLRPKKDFDFKNLPFVGFTYTSDKGATKPLEKGQNSK